MSEFRKKLKHSSKIVLLQYYDMPPTKRKHRPASSTHPRSRPRVSAPTSAAPSETRVSASAPSDPSEPSAPSAPSDLSGTNVEAVTLSAAHREAIAQTKKHGKSAECIRNSRNRIAEIIEWVLIKYPEYVNRGTVVVTNAERSDVTNNFLPRNTRDFLYSNLDVNIILGFMAWKKVKVYKQAKGKRAKKRQADTNPLKKDYMYSFETIRKYHDSILYGAEVKKMSLPENYHMEMKAFLDNYKKEYQGAKKAGKVEEIESDPFSFSLLRLICTWFVAKGNVFAWCFLLTQWNCMARSISVDCLGWHNMRKGEDSIVIKYDDTKSDKGGEKCSNKNIYSNPNDWYVCWYTALGCYCCIFSVSLCERDFLFIDVLGKIGTAADNFCAALSGLIDEYGSVVEEYVRLYHCNVHGIRKGSGTFASSCSTAPPPLVSIALRGEWSLGKVFDIYFKFGAIGDHYLGRILAGLNPHKSNFGDLPAHFSCGRENEFVDQAMHGMFGGLTKIHTVTNGILLLCLAAIVHHSDSIDEVILTHPGHIFGSMYIFNDRELLKELKKLVSQEPSGGIRNATGVPPHVVQMRLLESMNSRMSDLCLKINSQQSDLIAAVVTAIDENDVRSGVLTLNNFEVSLKLFVCILIY